MEKAKLIGAIDYRQYLFNYYKTEKSKDRPFSYRQFSKKCGFSSPNFIKLVIEGQRNLSSKSVEKLIVALELNELESSYFRTLVDHNQASKPKLKKILYERLKAQASYAKRRVLDDISDEYLSQWFYPVLREICLEKGYQDDLYWISKQLYGQVSESDINKGLNFLLSSGFIQRDDYGNFKSPDNIIVSTDEVRSTSIQKFYKNILSHTKEVLDEIPLEKREFGSLVFGLPYSSIPELKKRLKHFRKQIILWSVNQVKDCEACEVVQLNFQMFPQTKKKTD